MLFHIKTYLVISYQDISCIYPNPLCYFFICKNKLDQWYTQREKCFGLRTLLYFCPWCYVHVSLAKNAGNCRILHNISKPLDFYGLTHIWHLFSMNLTSIARPPLALYSASTKIELPLSKISRSTTVDNNIYEPLRFYENISFMNCL